MHGDQAELRRVGDGGVKVVHSGEAASQRVNTLVSVCLSTRGPAKFISACSSAEITKLRKWTESREIFVPDLSPAPAGQTVSASELSYFKRRGGPAEFSPPPFRSDKRRLEEVRRLVCGGDGGQGIH